MLVFVLSLVSGSKDGHIPTFWLLLYSIIILPRKEGHKH